MVEFDFRLLPDNGYICGKNMDYQSSSTHLPDALLRQIIADFLDAKIIHSLFITLAERGWNEKQRRKNDRAPAEQDNAVDDWLFSRPTDSEYSSFRHAVSLHLAIL